MSSYPGGSYDYQLYALLYRCLSMQADTIARLDKMEVQFVSFQDQLDRNTAATQQVVQGIQTEIAQLQDVRNQLQQALQNNQAPTQAQIDQLGSSTSALEQAATALAGDDQGTQAPAPTTGGGAPGGQTAPSTARPGGASPQQSHPQGDARKQ